MIARLQKDPRAWYAANKLPLPESLEEEAEKLGVEE
jgi:hypothetical protein